MIKFKQNYKFKVILILLIAIIASFESLGHPVQSVKHNNATLRIPMKHVPNLDFLQLDDAVRIIIDEYLSEPDSDKFKEAVTSIGEDPEKIAQKIDAFLDKWQSEHLYGTINPIQLFNDNDDLAKLLLKMYLQRYSKIWYIKKLIKEIFDILKENANDPDLAKKKVHEQIKTKMTLIAWQNKMAVKAKRDQSYIQLRHYFAGFKKDSVIVDVGVGKSNLSMKLAEQYRDMEFIATDVLNEEEIGRPKRHDLPNYKFRHQVSNVTFPFEDNSVDCIILSSVMHHVKSKEMHKFLEEVERVLKKDGMVILREDGCSDGIKVEAKVDGSIDVYLTKELIKKDERYIQEFFAFKDWFANIIINNKQKVYMWYNYFSLERWKELFEEHSFIPMNSKLFSFPYIRGIVTFRKMNNKGIDRKYSAIPINVDLCTKKALFGSILTVLQPDNGIKVNLVNTSRRGI